MHITKESVECFAVGISEIHQTSILNLFMPPALRRAVTKYTTSRRKSLKLTKTSVLKEKALKENTLSSSSEKTNSF